ncbi:MAG: hypothetical protein KOO60_03655 [Gemmatimonadales bacterium]|nr:hypothetical protein [Gemmatimonadales bacterium]
MRIHRSSLPISTTIVLLILGAASSFAEAPVIKNEKPQLQPKTIELVESWRVGGEEGDFIFGMMIDSMEDDDGNIYLLDSQICQVDVFSPTGEHLRTLSRQGEGPGEIRAPQCLIPLPDRTLGILELFPARFVTLSLDGDPKSAVSFGGDGGPQTGFPAALRAVHRGGTIMVAAQRTIPIENGQKQVEYLARLSETGEELVRYHEETMTVDFTKPLFVEKELLPSFFFANTVDSEGKVYTVRSWDEYAIEVYNSDGTLDKIIERDFQTRKRDKGEVRRLNALIDAWLTGEALKLERVLEPSEPAIAEMHIDDEGVLWVLHNRSGHDQPEGVFLTYDTFSPEGVWLQEVSIKAEGNPVYDGLRFLGGDRVLLVKGYALARWASRGAQNVNFGEEEAEAMEVIFCRMPKD